MADSEDTRPEFDLKRIKNTRAQIKGELTRFQTFLSKYDISVHSIELLQVRYETIKNILEKFKSVQTEYEELLLSDFPDDYNEDEANQERDAMENKYFEASATAQSILDKHFQLKYPAASGIPPAGEGGNVAGVLAAPELSHQEATLSNVAARLPLLTLPEFNGSYGDWQRFRDMFQAIVHNNKALSNVQRFYYLESSLKGEPKNIIASLSPTDANYSTAWELLERRYQNKKIMINAHLKEIMDMPIVSKESHVALRQLSNIFFKNYRSLESLGENVTQWNTILIYILVFKLDINSKREWEIFSKDKDSPDINDFNNFLMQRCQILEATDIKGTLNISSGKKYNETRSLVTTNNTNSNAVYRPKCPHCKDQHFIYFCEKFKALTTPERLNQAKKLSLCTNCLRYGHKTCDCQSQGCKICKQKHATLLHQSRENRNDTDAKGSDKFQNTQSRTAEDSNRGNGEVQNHTAIANYSITTEPFILLSTAVVKVYNSENQPLSCRVLLDSGSQSNFVTQELVLKLGLRIKTIHLPVSGIGQIKTNITGQVYIQLSSTQNSFQRKLSFLVIDKITDTVPQNFFEISNLNIPDEFALADPEFNVPSKVDMLLGASIFFELLSVGQVKLGKNLPILQKTILGWIITGKIPTNLVQTNSFVSQCLFTNFALEEQVEKFWRLEEVADGLNKNKLSSEEIECETHFVNNVSRNKEGRFIVKLPLRDNYLKLGDTENAALNRLYSIEKKLNNRPELKQAYQSFMLEYEQLGHMTQIPRDLESNGPIYYIPHHSVERPDSLTTKVRVVFDASCKSTTNISLNDVLKIGPVIQFDLFTILLRFRRHNFALIGDLTKMYRNVLIHDEHKDLQRIVWRNDSNEQMKCFQLNTITYGTASASYLATRCLKQIAIEKMVTNPIESKIIDCDFYMDDLLTGSQTSEKLIKIRENLTNIFLEYGFEIRKFQSNDSNLIKNLNQFSDSQYLITDDHSTKTLGVSWTPSVDSFVYKGQQLLSKSDKITKRTILSFIAKIFDPLGLLGPIIIRAKLILQRLWQLKTNWDESIPLELHSSWLEFRKQISEINLIRISRHVLVKTPINIQIHAFSDASENSYGCAVYLRSLDVTGEIKCCLLCAKSRVAPLKAVTLPRLELLGALLLSRLLKKCLSFFEMEIDSIFLYTDSTIVLSWLSSEPRTWQNFIANRVSEIQQLTRIPDWHYISTTQNPADIISRGAILSDLMDAELWWHGPSFLLGPPDSWPENTNISNFARSPSQMPEFKKPKPNLSFFCENEENNDFNIFEQYSSFSKLCRVTAFCFRFVQNINASLELKKFGQVTNQKEIAYLTNKELLFSTERLAKLAQQEAFAGELKCLKQGKEINRKSKLKSLSPFLDDNKLIRVGGRLKNSNLTYSNKHPIVLPAKHTFTKLVIDYEHKRTLHSGVQCTLSHVRQNYWPLNGKHIVRSHIRRCVTCFKANPRDSVPKMGDLPDARVIPSRPFTSVSVDYAGPFELKDGKTRTNKIIKGYICMFVCQATKAVHIEVITDLTSDGFLSVLKRFVSRRGFCTNIYSDNATNFVGSNNELIAIQKLANDTSFQNYILNANIKWHFMPAKSPHFGGLHEAAIKSCKHHLKRVLNQTHLHYEEFYTLTTQIEAILNSRPLIPVSSDPNDHEAITPAHFLIGQPLTAVPERNWTETKVNFAKRYRHLQLIGQHFWSRWRKEYLNHLQQRTKWQFDADLKVHVGSLVIMKEDNVPPMCWPLGRVIEIHPGKDNVTRVVTVKTQSGVFKRAITRVCLLPIDTGEQ